MKNGLRIAASVLGGTDATVLLIDLSFKTVAGIALLLWANNVYEASKREE